MAITTLNNLSINRSDTAAADNVWTATSATATDFQAASSDFVKLATYTASDDATLEMDGDFTADYKTYLYVINELVPATSNKTLYIRYRQSDADVTGSNYKYQIGQMYYDSGGSASITTEGGYNTTFAKLTMGDGVNNLTEGCCGRIMLFNPLGTVARKYYTTEIFSQRTNEETMQTRMGGGLYDANNTALTGITLYWDAGNVTSGTVSVYGLKP